MHLTTCLLSLAAGLSPGASASPSEWTAEGSVLDHQGVAAPGATVAAFDPLTLEIIGAPSVVDSNGNYRIEDLPQSVHLVAGPAEGSPLAASWLFDQDLLANQAESFQLALGAPVSITVLDRQGETVAGAQVAAYTAGVHRLGEIGVVDTATTGPDGTATLMAPTFAHLVADASDQGLLPSWRFRRRLSTSGNSYSFTVDQGAPVSGRVFSSSFEPLEGMEISAWSYSNGWHWNGLKQTDATGSYDILAGDRHTRVQANDPSKQRVSGRSWRRGAGGSQLSDITMLDGVPLRIQTKNSEGEPVRSKIWVHALATRSWAFLGYSDGGVLDTIVPSIYHVHVRPVDRSLIAKGFHNVTASEAGDLEVVHEAGRNVNVTVKDSIGAPLKNVEIRPRMSDGIWLGGRWTNAAGQTTIQVSSTGISTVRVWDRAHGSTLERQHLAFNGSADSGELEVNLSGESTVSGTIKGLDGSLIQVPMRVYSLSQAGWRSVTTETGEYTVPTGDRYHLLVLPVDPESTYLPSWHWRNVLPSDGVHSRGPVILTRGYHAEVQVVATDNGNAPVEGVRVVGGHPGQVSGSDGWVKTLLRPVYTLRNYPPSVSPSNPNPIIPDRFRAHTSIESERTRASGGPLDPIEVFTRLGTIATGRVTGPLPGGGTGPLAGIRVTSHGGRRYLGDATTNADGKFHVVGVEHDAEYGFKTSFVVRPRHEQPYLADVLRNQTLETPASTGTNPVGDIEISAAAYGSGRVVDAFGEPIDDRTVHFRARRLDRHPRWHTGWGRISSSTGEFLTKVATRTQLMFYTRFWNQGWLRKWFKDERTFDLGDSVDLGDFQLGEAPIVEFRAITSVASAGGHASPVARAYVELIRISDGKVMDWGRTDASGDLQLRGPENEPLKLRYSFFVWSYWILGVPFDPVFSEEFEPQETDPFTLTGQGQVTNFGDFYILSPLTALSIETLEAFQNAPPGAFKYNFLKDALVAAAASGGRTLTLATGMTDTAQAKGVLEDSLHYYARLLGVVQDDDYVIDPSVRAELEATVIETINDISLLIDSLEL